MARPGNPELTTPLTAYFEGQVLSGALPAGTRIEPLRTLRTRFGVSYSTAQRGVAELIRRGILSKAGKNIVAGSAEHPGLMASEVKIAVYMTPTCRTATSPAWLRRSKKPTAATWSRCGKL